ncbi:hypothetical protein B0H14DRAFT_2979154, partial [Mycena olivaceomarginata]
EQPHVGLRHTYASGSASASHTHARTPPSSYSHHSSAAPRTPKILPAAAAAVSSQAAQDDGPKPPGLMWRLRGGARVLHRLPAAAVLRAGRAAGPEHPRGPPSSLLNPPSSLLNPPPTFGAARRSSGMGGWRPPPGQPQPLPSPALMDGSADGGDGERREGLLRPGLAVLLPASHSIRSLGDHVDYSRPIGARVNVRMESAATFVTMESVDEAREGQAGEWLPPLP